MIEVSALPMYFKSVSQGNTIMLHQQSDFMLHFI